MDLKRVGTGSNGCFECGLEVEIVDTRGTDGLYRNRFSAQFVKAVMVLTISERELGSALHPTMAPNNPFQVTLYTSRSTMTPGVLNSPEPSLSGQGQGLPIVSWQTNAD